MRASTKELAAVHRRDRARINGAIRAPTYQMDGHVAGAVAVVFQVDPIGGIAVVLQPGLPWHDAAVGMDGLDLWESIATVGRRPFKWCGGRGGGMRGWAIELSTQRNRGRGGRVGTGKELRQ